MLVFHCIAITNEHLVFLVSTEKPRKNGWKLNLFSHSQNHMETGKITASELSIMQIVISQLFLTHIMPAKKKIIILAYLYQ